MGYRNPDSYLLLQRGCVVIVNLGEYATRLLGIGQVCRFGSCGVGGEGQDWSLSDGRARQCSSGWLSNCRWLLSFFLLSRLRAILDVQSPRKAFPWTFDVLVGDFDR